MGIFFIFGPNKVWRWKMMRWHKLTLDRDSFSFPIISFPSSFLQHTALTCSGTFILWNRLCCNDNINWSFLILLNYNWIACFFFTLCHIFFKLYKLCSCVFFCYYFSISQCYSLVFITMSLTILKHNKFLMMYCDYKLYKESII